MTSVYIRNLKPEDVSDICLLEEKYFNPAWSENMIISEIADSHSEFIVCTVDDKIVGYLSFKHVLDEGEINRVCVDLPFRNNKIASKLMECILCFCKEQEISFVFLEVRESNHPAISLYKKYGFEAYAVRKAYYHDGENAIMMKKELTNCN